jgi:hypothetical protein
MHPQEWSFKQSFSLRASTLLLLTLPLLATAGRLLSHQGAEVLAQLVGSAASSHEIIAFLAAVFGLSFFLNSCLKKRPQAQYLAEFVAAIAYIVFTPIQ